MTGRDERSLTVGRKNFRLMLDSDTAGGGRRGWSRCRSPACVATAAGTSCTTPDYVAPSLHIGASPRLMSMTHRLLEILEAKAD